MHVFKGSLAFPRSAQLVPLILRDAGITKFEFLYAVALVIGLVAVEVASTRTDLIKRFLAQPVWVRWPSYYVACMAIWILGVSGEARAFIYFQF
jgi:hypothetical protein